MSGPLEEHIGSMIACEELLSECGADFHSPPVMSPSSLVNETPGEGIYDNRIPSGGFVFRQIRGVQRKTLSALAVF